MSGAATLVRQARTEAGLTQTELARRMRTTQTAIARLERQGANPTVATLGKALAAAGRKLELAAGDREPAVDIVQLARHVQMTPAERLAAHQAAHDNMRRLLGHSGDG
ncbi:MAG: helix-turn-helix transcriptional regulator [Thermoleophilaceae bacterium]|nr:helix-turn-helix transcriptional regulator [Thermoleophilaceae bacterium]